MESNRVIESWVSVEDGYRVWTQMIGGGAAKERPPLLVVHGGPGMAHDYLANLATLASAEQRVVFYDQLGCGRSDQPEDQTRWQMPRFVQEVDTIRQTLGLSSVVILGQSWGGMLAIEYLLTQPSGIKGLILSNSLSSAPLLTHELKRLKQALPPQILATLEQHEANGSTDSPAYRKASEAFYSRHILRADPLPEAIRQAIGSVNTVYEVMWGKNEFSVTGNLKDWDRTGELRQIQCSTLIISGEFDESTPAINQVLQQGLTNARAVLMPGCSHLCHLENPDAYFDHVQKFLDQINEPTKN
jgi:proline-specific peptidase